MKKEHPSRSMGRPRPPLPPQVQQVVDAMHPCHNDPLGSWTGLPTDGGEPVRDVDDC